MSKPWERQFTRVKCAYSRIIIPHLQTWIYLSVFLFVLNLATLFVGHSVFFSKTVRIEDAQWSGSWIFLFSPTSDVDPWDLVRFRQRGRFFVHLVSPPGQFDTANTPLHWGTSHRHVYSLRIQLQNIVADFCRSQPSKFRFRLLGAIQFLRP